MPEILDEAEAELRAAAAWYDDRRPGLGDRFLDAAAAALTRVDGHALEGAPWVVHGVPPGVRRMALPSFPYRLVYVVEPRTVVVAVAHDRQRPGYWRGRLKGL